MRKDIYGLRLLREPAGQRAVLFLVLGIVVAFRLIQLVILSEGRLWAADFSYYWTAGLNLLDGDPIYSAQQLSGPYVPEGQTGFLYPPAFAVLMVPFAAISPTDYRLVGGVWAALGTAILVASVVAVIRAESLDRRFARWPEPRTVWFVLAALVFPPVIAELSVGNVHLEILGLLVVAWLGVRSGGARGDVLAGVAVGAATLLKIFPGLLILWFLATGRWRAAGWAVAAAVALAIGSIPFTGVQAWLDYPTVLLNMGGVLDIHDSVSPTLWLAPVLGFDLARWLVIALSILAVVVSSRRLPRQVSFSVAVVAAVVVSPAVFHHYLSVLVLPLLLALSAGVRPQVVALAYLLMWGGQQPALGEDLSMVLSRVPQTLGWLLLLGALLVAKGRPAASEPSALAPAPAAAPS